MTLTDSDFIAIETELRRLPLDINAYRVKSGLGRTQAFGVVGRRSMAPDYSRNCWTRTYLYKLLLDFGKKHVTDISWNAITVNQDYQAEKHRDKHNLGPSYLVAFGNYEGGSLVIHEGDLSGEHNICHQPIITDFSKIFHSVNDFIGTRYSLVYYNYDLSWKGEVVKLPPPYIEYNNDKWNFFRGTELIGKEGLPHPLKGRKKAIQTPRTPANFVA
jgi:hypothetical protein